ncbi:MAG: carbohydrate ABC transporter permease, partial [Fimbriimonadales bacterium]
LVVMGLLGTLLSSALVAYGFARLRWPGKGPLFTVMLSTMMLPGAVTLLPSFLIFRSLGWIDTLYPMWVPAFFASAFNVFLLRQFFLNIPMELEDAAKIDGCSYLRTFWQVMLPQVKPALAVIAIWTFMGAWNNFMGPLIYVSSPENMPIAYAVQLFQSDRGGEPGLIMAFATMAMLPVLLVFFLAQKYFIEGVQLTGLGGR